MQSSGQRSNKIETRATNNSGAQLILMCAKVIIVKIKTIKTQKHANATCQGEVDESTTTFFTPTDEPLTW